MRTRRRSPGHCRFNLRSRTETPGQSPITGVATRRWHNYFPARQGFRAIGRNGMRGIESSRALGKGWLAGFAIAAFAALLGSAPAASAASITTPGPLTEIRVNDELGC